jgi:proton-dependent oligopeptide transporter, POT family
MSKAEQDRFPSSIKYIIGNEGCERFSYYGMRSILTIYMVGLFMAHGMAEADAGRRATQNYHYFVAGVYALPMIGAILADRLLGKYRTIFWLSLVYCAGHAVLAITEGTINGLYLGLALIAVGSGGIKPCVSANVGDQFTSKNAHLVSKVFAAFYFIINFGSFFATLLIPWLKKEFGASVAFGVPGILMFIATIIFWMGRNRFIKIPPAPGGRLGLLDAFGSISLFLVLGVWMFELPLYVSIGISVTAFVLWLVLFGKRQSVKEDTGFVSVLLYSIKNRNQRKPGGDFFSAAEGHFGEEVADGPRAVLRIVRTFLLVSVFWALFDQHGSSWILQADKMDRVLDLPFFGRIEILASQVAAANPAMVMMLIPIMTYGVYPLCEKLGFKMTPLRRMTGGMLIAATSFVVVALIEQEIVAQAALGQKVNIGWQMLAYVLITIAEVMVSVTGLEFAYTQAPRAMKSTVMGFWLMTVTLGNLLVAFLAGFKDLPMADFFWTFAALMAGAGVLFGVNAYFYKVRDYLQRDADPKPASSSNELPADAEPA